MDILEQTNIAISSNSYLSQALKDNIKELIAIFYNNFKDVSLDNFNERIKTLQVIKGSKFVIKDAVSYNSKENVIYINEGELQEVDARHSLMRILLMIITSKDNFYGFNENNKLEALNEGLTEMIANFLVGNEDESDGE